MRLYMSVVYVVAGMLFGFFAAQFFSSDFSLFQDKNEKASQLQLVENKNLENPAEQKPVCPACPCIYSDEVLVAPQYDPRTKEILETNHEGEVLVRWIDVPGAKQYNIHVENEKGKTVKSFKSTRSLAYLKDFPLPDGKLEAKYWIRLATVNGKDQEGPRGEKRELNVKPQANVTAPIIQEIKVED